MDLMNDSVLTMEEKGWIVKFQGAVEERLNTIAAANGELTENMTLFTIGNTIGLDVSNLHKDGALLGALWYVILSALHKRISLENMKYPTMDSFLTAYEPWFTSEPECEKRYLWHTANWMNILFKMITARKNKGLAILVVPRLIEGWDAKYVTGSGQTKATANRVHIFETEGNVKPNERGKAKLKKKVGAAVSAVGTVRAASTAGVGAKSRKKQRIGAPVLSTAAADAAILGALGGSGAGYGYTFVEPFGTVAQQRNYSSAVAAAANVATAAAAALTNNTRQNAYTRSNSSSRGNSSTLTGLTDKEEEEDTTGSAPAALDTGVKKTFEAWQEATENYGLGLLSLSRSNSYANNGLARNSDQQLTDPMDYQRGFSWTEIPANNNGGSSTSGGAGFPSMPPLHSFPSVDLAVLGLQATENKLELGRSSSGGVVSSEEISELFKGYK
mmetsp:Transcript_31088/g.52507  ORF Transcript_31088/g.52507 Transcript_31088/m.52507 type:complete len:444 (-) Transcript_31088:359-1690(-)